jgi:hypothetical protein
MRLSHAAAAIVLSIAALVSSAGVAAPPTIIGASGAQLPQGQGAISGGRQGSTGDVTSNLATIAISTRRDGA